MSLTTQASALKNCRGQSIATSRDPKYTCMLRGLVISAHDEVSLPDELAGLPLLISNAGLAEFVRVLSCMIKT
jgi:hypothetical protein